MSTLLAEPSRHVTPDDPAAPLWVGTHVNESGYRNVYRDWTGHGRPSGLWRARWCKRVNLNGRWPTPRAAAVALAQWAAKFYGPLGCDWVDVLRAQRRNLVRLRGLPGGGWAADVFVLGRPVLVDDSFGSANLPAHVPTPGLPLAAPPELGRWRWATKKQARRAADEWLRRFRASLGARRRFAGLYLWRAG